MTTVWKALCEELLGLWDAQPLPPYESSWASVIARARRALLAQPEHEVASPTQDELWELWLRLDRELPDRPAAVAAFWEHAQVEARARCGRPAPVPAEEEEPCLQWTENRPPGTDDCPYDHCIAETPFGRFLITWKSWKEHGSPTVDETPWGDWWQAFSNVDKAKDACKREYVKRLLTCRVDNSAAPLERHPAPVPVAIPGEEYHDDMGAVTWWRFPVDEPPWVGTPNDSDWPGYHTHFTPAPPEPFNALPLPAGEVAELEARLRRASDGASAMGWEQDSWLLARAADLLEQRHPAPVPVAERLPGPEDCDAEGMCWWFYLECPGEHSYWILAKEVYCEPTYWLPVTALPLPQGEVE